MCALSVKGRPVSPTYAPQAPSEWQRTVTAFGGGSRSALPLPRGHRAGTTHGRSRCVRAPNSRRQRSAAAMYQTGRYPPPPPLLPFQWLTLTAKILLRRLRCQEDFSFKIGGPPSTGTIGGPWEKGGSQPTPPPFLIHPWPCLVSGAYSPKVNDQFRSVPAKPPSPPSPPPSNTSLAVGLSQPLPPFRGGRAMARAPGCSRHWVGRHPGPMWQGEGEGGDGPGPPHSPSWQGLPRRNGRRGGGGGAAAVGQKGASGRV